MSFLIQWNSYRDKKDSAKLKKKSQITLYRPFSYILYV